jgi:hypothetical protein
LKFKNELAGFFVTINFTVLRIKSRMCIGTKKKSVNFNNNLFNWRNRKPPNGMDLLSGIFSEKKNMKEL